MNHENETTSEIREMASAAMEELCPEEALQVFGGGLLSSPLGTGARVSGVWVREVVEDVEAY